MGQQGNTCSWKGQLETVVGKNEKLESLKLESFAEVGKNQTKLERAVPSWKASFEVGKFG